VSVRAENVLRRALNSDAGQASILAQRSLVAAGAVAVTVVLVRTLVLSRSLAVMAAAACLMLALVATGSPLLPILAVPGAWFGDRLPATQGFLSMSDGFLAVGALATLPRLKWGRLPLGGLLVPIVGFEATQFLALLHSPSLPGVVAWLHRPMLLAGGLLIGAYLQQEGRLLLALRLFAVAGVVVAGAAVADTLAHHLQPAYPFDQQKNYMGDLLAAGVLVTYALPEIADRRSLVRTALIAALFVGLLATQSRGALIALGVGLVVLTIVRNGFTVRSTFTLLLALALIGLTVSQVQEDAAREMAQDNAFGSVTSRTDFQQQAVDLWRSSPVLGIGIHFFQLQTASLRSDPHNVVLLTLAESGAVGLLGFAVLLIGVGRLLWMRGSPLAPVALAAITFRFTHGLFDIYWLHGAELLPWVLAGAALMAASGRGRDHLVVQRQIALGRPPPGERASAIPSLPG
jgi:O-antigen ligase